MMVWKEKLFNNKNNYPPFKKGKKIILPLRQNSINIAIKCQCLKDVKEGDEEKVTK